MNTIAHPLPTIHASHLSPQEFCALPWAERRKLAWQFFPAALALATSLGPLKQANDGTPAEVGCAFANWSLLKDGWCECKHDHRGANDECFWHSPDSGSHGWMCPQCLAMTQVG